MSENQPRPVKDRLLTVDQAAEYLGCSRSWFFRNVRPVIPTYKLSNIMFSQQDLDRFVESRRDTPVGLPDPIVRRPRHSSLNDRAAAAAKRFGLE